MAARPVLVVDDDADNRTLLEHLLSSMGYAVATASDGCEALNCLAGLRPAVILLDLEMPVMDGRTFRQRQLQLAASLRSIPVIVCSGSDEADKLTDELRPFASLSKPFPDHARLLSHVEAAYQLSAEPALPAA
jgi:CheY-like chemotaxis protein